MSRPKFRPKRAARKRAGRDARAAALAPSQLIFGMHAAEAALLNPARTVRRAFLTANAAAKLAPALSERDVEVVPASPHDLDALAGGNAVHQGVVLHVEPLSQPDLHEFLNGLPKEEAATVAVLDQVTDPHNVGAVLRSAAAFAVSALIVQDRHSPPLSATLAKAASGALDLVPVIAVINLARALAELKDAGFACIGFDSDAPTAWAADALAAPRQALVFGAEDKGLRRLVRECCDRVLALAAPGPIKSLNISNAAAIVFYEAAKQRRAG